MWKDLLKVKLIEISHSRFLTTNAQMFHYRKAFAEHWMLLCCEILVLLCCGTAILTLQMVWKYKNWTLMYISATTWLWSSYWKRVWNTLSLIACTETSLCRKWKSLWKNCKYKLQFLEGMVYSKSSLTFLFIQTYSFVGLYKTEKKKKKRKKNRKRERKTKKGPFLWNAFAWLFTSKLSKKVKSQKIPFN